MILDLLLALSAIPAVITAGWLFILTVFSRRGPRPAEKVSYLRFDLVVPAHDEEKGIARTIRSLLALHYPRNLYRIVVVADNCIDDTAGVARREGALVLVRNDQQRRGKGQALTFAFAQVLRGDADAVVVVDADTVVSPNLLLAFASRLSKGAEAMQADYCVQEDANSWRIRLMRIAFTLMHVVRSLGRERLGLSCGLRGNGMCFSRSLLTRVPHDACSIVEDIEYGLRLGEQGVRVVYVAEARVWGEMVSGAQASVSQRRRWEGGRYQLARERALPILVAAVRRRSLLLFDLAMDLLVPPLAQIGLVIAVGEGLSLALAVGRRNLGPGLWLWSAAAAFLFIYLARGWQVSGAGLRGLLDLALSPAYVFWKMSVYARTATRNTAWVRTARQGKPS